MDRAVFTSFAAELKKSSSGMDSFKALDRAGQMAGAGVSRAVATPPRIGTFGVKTVGVKTAAPQQPDVMDRESWKQTAKDLPRVIAATMVGYGVGKTLAEEIGKRVAVNAFEAGVKPGWVRHAPMAAAVLSSMASYSFGRSQEEARRRRDEARKRGGE